MADSNNQVSVNILLGIEGQGQVRTVITGITNDIQKQTATESAHAQAVDKVKNAQEQYNKVLQKAQQQYGLTEKQVQGLIKAHETQSTKLAQTQFAINSTSGEIEKMSFWQKISQEQWKSAIPWLNTANNALNTLRWTMVNVTFGLLAVGAALSPFILLTKYGMELETLFTKIQVVTDTLASTALSSVRKLREGTIFSIQEMGNAYLEFAKRGFKAQETLAALPAITNLATASQIELTDSVKIVGQVLQTFSMNVDQASHVTDVIAKAAAESAADVGDFGVALSYAAPAAVQAGFSFEETSAALAMLTNAGLSASKAGTSLNALMTQMINPSDAVKKEMKKVGLSFTDAEGRMKSLDQATKEIAASMKLFKSEGEALEFLNELLDTRGSRAGSTFIAGIESGSTIEKFTERIDDFGYAQESAGIIGETSANRLKTSWNDFKDTFVPAGNAFNAVLATTLDLFSALFNVTPDTDLQNVLNGVNAETEKTKALMDNVSNETKQWLDNLSKGTKMVEIEIGGRTVFAIQPVTAEEIIKEEEDKLEQQNLVLENAKRGFIDSIIDIADNIEEVFKDKTVKQIETLIDAFEKLRVQAETAGFDTELNSITSSLSRNRDEAIELSKEIKISEELSDKWKDRISELNSMINNKNKTLKENQNALKGVNEQIRILSNPRFVGQLSIERLIGDAELFLKKQELATFGITDAQKFLQDALSKSKDGYEGLFASIEKVNLATKDGQNTYEAWRETVQTFIEETIQAGNDLGENVSRTVGKFAGLLLNTSKFTDESENQEEVISLLRDAYDVHYGAMTDDVSFAIKEHEEAGRTIFDTSGQIISALGQQWTAQNLYTGAVATTTLEIQNLQNELDGAQDSYERYQSLIRDTSNRLNEMAEAANRAAEAAARAAASGGGGGGGSSSSKKSTSKSTSYTTYVPKSGYVNSEGYNQWGWKALDFVMRPGQAPVSFSKQDTIVGFKGNSPMGGVTIQNVNITGVSGDASTFAQEFARELRRELRTM